MAIKPDELQEQVQDFTPAIPGTRHELLEEWLDDPEGVIEQAREANVPLDSWVEQRAPANAEHRGWATEELLYNQGIRVVDNDRLGILSTRARDLPDIDPVKGQPDPMARLLIGYFDQCYQRTLMTGVRTASLSTQTVNSIWRPISDGLPFRQPQISPSLDFTRLLAFQRRITEDTYRINRWKNASSEQVMQELAEGTEPKLFEITRDSNQLEMSNYRAGIEATDSFLNANQTRASDITNAIEEIAIGHRIALLRALAKLIRDSMPSGNSFDASASSVLGGGIAFTAGKVDYPRWTEFMTKFGSAYQGNTAIGNEASITALKLMSITDGDNLSLGSWSMMPNSQIEDLNGDMTRLAYGWIDGVSELAASKLTVFQRETTAAFIQRMGMDQDEMERVPGPRKTRRWLGTESLFAILDETGIREFDFS